MLIKISTPADYCYESDAMLFVPNGLKPKKRMETRGRLKKTSKTKDIRIVTKKKREKSYVRSSVQCEWAMISAFDSIVSCMSSSTT